MWVSFCETEDSGARGCCLLGAGGKKIKYKHVDFRCFVEHEDLSSERSVSLAGECLAAENKFKNLYLCSN